MKKTIALLLSAMMILGCAGCKSKSQDETTKRSKKSKSTTITETEVPTESSEEPETSSSEETSESETEPTETTRTYSATKVPFEVRHDAKSVDMKVGLIQKGYSVPVKDADVPYESVASSAFRFYFAMPENTNDKVIEVTDNIFHSKYTEMMEKYLESVEKLDAQSDAEPNLYSSWIEFDVKVHRDDSRVISFSTIDNTTDTLSYTYAYYNIDGTSGKEIGYRDVVKDKDALAKYVDEWGLRLQPEQRETMIHHIEDETVSFILYTNGIELRYHEDNGYSYVSVFVPAFSCPEAFNTYYFESIPQEDYSVMGNDLQAINWDIDGDGIIDNIDTKLGDADGTQIIVGWNDKEFTFDSTSIPYLASTDIYPEQNPYAYPCLMYTRDDCFLMVEALGLKSVHLFTFKLENGEVKYCDAMQCYEFWQGYSSDDIFVGLEKNVIGNMTCYQDYEITPEGKFGKISQNYVCYGNFITLKDLTVTEISDEGHEIGEMTLPAGSKVTARAYSEETNTVCLEMQTKDGKTGELMLLDLNTIDDMDSAFVYVFHGE